MWPANRDLPSLIHPMNDQNRQTLQFFDTLEALVRDRRLARLVLSNRRDPSTDLKSIIVTLVELRKGIRLNFIYRHETRDITQNYDPAEGLALIRQSMEQDFLNADLLAPGETTRYFISAGGKVKLRKGPNTLAPAVSLAHDRVRERIVAPEGNIYLRELGVLNAAFQVRPEMKDKYLQVTATSSWLARPSRNLNCRVPCTWWIWVRGKDT
jgi:hypothetical protein